MNANWYPAVWAAGIAVLCCALNADAVDRAVYHEGDTWTYRVIEGPTTWGGGPFTSTVTKTITRVGADEFEMSVVAIPDRGEKKTSTELLSLDLDDFIQLSPDAPRQESKTWIWPVDESQSWTYEVPVPGGKQVWQARVKSWEEIQVAAGTFKALKVERELISAPGIQTIMKAVSWYSPAAKMSVRWETRGSSGMFIIRNVSRELLSYRVQ